MTSCRAYNKPVSHTFERVRALAAAGDVRISEHGYDELAEDGILAGEVLDAAGRAVVVADYPDYPKGPCVLVLNRDADGRPIHTVWGIPKGCASPAVLVTAYRPDPQKWDSQFMRRKQ